MTPVIDRILANQEGRLQLTRNEQSQEASHSNVVSSCGGNVGGLQQIDDLEEVFEDDNSEVADDASDQSNDQFMLGGVDEDEEEPLNSSESVETERIKSILKKKQYQKKKSQFQSPQKPQSGAN